MKTIQHPFCGVIPPHMQNHIAAASDAEQRDRALSTLDQMRTMREGRSLRAVASTASTPQPHKQRNVYDAQHHNRLPGKLVLSEGKRPTGDVEVNEAYVGAGAMYDFLHDVFGRNSIDDHGKRIDSTVHYGVKFDNAFWDGHQMIYGDGDGILFLGFTKSLDVICHEISHGLTQFTAKLGYSDETGAINEHISDVFGIMAKQYTYGQLAADSDWLIGEEILGPSVDGIAIRSLAAPGTAYDDPVLGKDPQPAHMKDYVKTDDDNGGVHINSGIPNHAFYLAALTLGGYTWEVLGQVWYRTLETGLRPDAVFTDLARATVATAGQLYTVGGKVQRAIARAWAAVGLPVPVAGGTPALLQPNDSREQLAA